MKWQSQESNFDIMTLLPKFSATESQRRDELGLREETWKIKWSSDIFTK